MTVAISEEAVFALLPFEIKRPAEVRADGQGGVTVSTYALLRESVATELEVRLGTQVPEALHTHKLLEQAAALLLAATICRKLKSYQDQANSMFADANIKIRLFFDNVVGSPEGGALSAQVVIETVSTALTDTQLAQSDPFLSVFAAIRV